MNEGSEAGEVTVYPDDTSTANVATQDHPADIENLNDKVS